MFFLSETELVKYFEYYSISVMAEGQNYSFREFTSKREEDKYFKFTLTQTGYTNARITQKFERMLTDKNYKYSPATLQMGKIEDQNTVTYLGEGDKDTYFGAKSIHALQEVGSELEPGDYFIRVRMLWNDEKKYNSAVLAVYAAEPVKIEELDGKKGNNYLI